WRLRRSPTSSASRWVSRWSSSSSRRLTFSMSSACSSSSSDRVVVLTVEMPRWWSSLLVHGKGDLAEPGVAAGEHDFLQHFEGYRAVGQDRDLGVQAGLVFALLGTRLDALDGLADRGNLQLVA